MVFCFRFSRYAGYGRALAGWLTDPGGMHTHGLRLYTLSERCMIIWLLDVSLVNQSLILNSINTEVYNRALLLQVRVGKYIIPYNK